MDTLKLLKNVFGEGQTKRRRSPWRNLEMQHRLLRELKKKNTKSGTGYAETDVSATLRCRMPHCGLREGEGPPSTHVTIVPAARARPEMKVMTSYPSEKRGQMQRRGRAPERCMPREACSTGTAGTGCNASGLLPRELGTKIHDALMRHPIPNQQSPTQISGHRTAKIRELREISSR